MYFATVVDSKALLQSVLAALIAGVGVTAIFCIAIFGAARFADMNRSGRPAAAVAFGLVAILALVAFAGAIVVGLVVMTSKS
jgi:hypothetical protein